MFRHVIFCFGGRMLVKGRGMREYQREKDKDYILNRNVYMQTIWCIRDYDRLREMDDITARYRASCIDKALDTVPREYREGLMDNIMSHSRYEEFAHENTWKMWKQRFIFHAANNLGINIGGENEQTTD